MNSYVEVLLESWHTLSHSDELDDRLLLWDLESALASLPDTDMDIVRGLYMSEVIAPERVDGPGAPKGGSSLSLFASNLYPDLSQNAAILRVWKSKRRILEKLEGILKYESITQAEELC